MKLSKAISISGTGVRNHFPCQDEMGNVRPASFCQDRVLSILIMLKEINTSKINLGRLNRGVGSASDSFAINSKPTDARVINTVKLMGRFSIKCFNLFICDIIRLRIWRYHATHGLQSRIIDFYSFL